MDRDEAFRILEQHADDIRSRGVTRLALYGSTVRGDAGDDSDVDVLVDIDQSQRFSLLDLVGLQHYLADILGREAQVAQRKGLKPFLKDTILAEAVEIFPEFGRRLATPGANPRPRRSPRQWLQDILDATVEIESFIAGKSFADYLLTVVLRKAVERNIEIISEASRRLPEDLKAQHTAIPWSKIAAIGSVLRHAYPDIDHKMLWEITTRELSPLRQAIEAMIRDVDRREGR